MGHAGQFNSFAYAKKLKSAGFTEDQVEVQVELITELVDEQLATKVDIELIRKDIAELRKASKHDIESLRSDMAIKIEKSKTETIKWVGGFLITQFALMLTSIKLMS